MFTVGPRMTEAPLALASAACNAPPFLMRSKSHVAARPVPGSQVSSEMLAECRRLTARQTSGRDAVEEPRATNAIGSIGDSDRGYAKSMYGDGVPEVYPCQKRNLFLRSQFGESVFDIERAEGRIL